MASVLDLPIGDHVVRLSRPDKVLFPAAGFTKRDLAEYLVAIAPVLLPHLTGRAITLARFPDGVDAPGWFQSNCPPGRPDWVPVVDVTGTRGQRLRYCRLEEAAALAWAANTAALELHPFLALAAAPGAPLAVVFDLDPGAPAGLALCAVVALRIRAMLADDGLYPVVKTSGMKGLHVSVPLDASQPFAATRSFARGVAERLAAETPAEVTAKMALPIRRAKVLVDWRQNSAGLQMVAPYSLRAGPVPRVSTPITWEEVERAAAGENLAYGPREVLARVEEMGDVFSGRAQRVPQ